MLKQAVIMAGGEGKRLLPLTEERPKPLMPLLDEPVIGMTLQLLRRHGVDRATVTLRYRAKQVMDALGDGSAYGVRLKYTVEDTPRGTAGSVRDAVQSMRGTVLVMSGDGLTDCDLTELYQAHKASGAKLSLVVRRMEGDTSAYGVCSVSDGFLTALEEKRQGSLGGLVNTGIYFAEEGVLDRVAENGIQDFAADLIPGLLADGERIAALETRAYWCDIGSRDAYHQAQMDLLMGRVGLTVHGTRLGRAIIAPGSRVAPGVRVTGRCYIGYGASVGGGSVLGAGTILSAGARVGKNVRLENTTLWEHASIGCGAVLRNVVVIPEKDNRSLQRLVLCGGNAARKVT